VTFARSILLLAGVSACVSLAIFAGYALSTHHLAPVYIGLVAFAAGALLLFVYNRTGGGANEPAGGGH
jgi:hypothetical protein